MPKGIKIEGINLSPEAIEQIGYLQGEENMAPYYNDGIDKAAEVLFTAFDNPDNLKLEQKDYSLIMQQMYNLKRLVKALNVE